MTQDLFSNGAFQTFVWGLTRDIYCICLFLLLLTLNEVNDGLLQPYIL